MIVTAHPLALFVFVLSNVMITLGYVYLAVAVLPNIPVTLRRTKIGGVGFFLLCGLTHLNMALDALFNGAMMLAQMATSWHALSIHGLQAVAVWMFVTGLYIEVGRWKFPPLNPKQDQDT